MIYKSHKHRFWLFFIIFSVILCLLWFFNDLKKTDDKQIITDTERKVAEPMPDTITIEVLDSLINRLSISETDLNTTQPYSVASDTVTRLKLDQ
jgi:hypothetical protein